MPFLSFLPAIKYFGHFQNPDTFVVDINLLPAVDFAMGIGRCVNDDPLKECAGKLKMVSPKDQTVKAAKQIGISFGD